MKLTVFDRKKFTESLRKLRVRKAPGYIIEAYKDGYVGTVNEYYRIKLKRKLGKPSVHKESHRELLEKSKQIDLDFLQEALTQKDLDFIMAFFKMANIDLMTGDKLPPDAAKLIKQGIAKDLDLEDLFKKLR